MLAACVLRARVTTKKGHQLFWRKKVHPGDLAGGFSDLEMAWLLYCAGAATAWSISAANFFMMRTLTDDLLGMPVPRDISRTVLWVRGWSSWLRTVSFTWSMFSSVRALCGLSLPWSRSTVPVSLNFLSNLLMQRFVHPLSGNSFLDCLASHHIPSTDIIFCY